MSGRGDDTSSDKSGGTRNCHSRIHAIPNRLRLSEDGLSGNAYGSREFRFQTHQWDRSFNGVFVRYCFVTLRYEIKNRAFSVFLCFSPQAILYFFFCIIIINTYLRSLDIRTRGRKRNNNDVVVVKYPISLAPSNTVRKPMWKTTERQRRRQ